MRQFLNTLKHPKPSPGTQPTPLSLPKSFTDEQFIFQFRKHRGVNLGSWFVLERWITDAPFRNAAQPAQSDLDVARGKHAKANLESHWNSWITEDDWKWLREHGFNSVRIPIGYYHLAGMDPSLLDGTDFRDFKDIFVNAWSKIQEAFSLAYKYHIGVLIDLHAAPGKQNPDSHSGTSNPPTFFSSKHNLKHTTHILTTLLTHLLTFLHETHTPNLIGIQLLNEPHPPSDTILQSWYTTTIHQLRSINATVPLYLGECWRLDSYSDWLVAKDLKSHGLVVLDHHLYRCFTSSDIHTPASGHISSLNSNGNGSTTFHHFSTISEKLSRVSSGSGFVIGEWSGALNPNSLTQSTTSGFAETKSYIDAQLRLYDKSCSGWFFWTYKKQHSGDFGWSVRDAVNTGTFPNCVGMRLSSAVEMVDIIPDEVDTAKTTAKTTAVDTHVKYWSQYPGHYAHELFAEGYEKGWDTAFTFFTFNLNGRDPVTELGFIRACARHQTNNHDQGKNYWEYEHGFVQAVDEARMFLRSRYGFN